MAGRLSTQKPGGDTGQRLLPWLGWIYLTLALLLAWELLSQAYPSLIASPSDTVRGLERLGAAFIMHAVGVTLANSLAGYALALLGAVASLAAAYVNRHLNAFFNAFNTFIQSVSILVWSIVFVMIFGVTSRKPPVLVAAAASYPILLSSLMGASKLLSRRFGLLARVLGASKAEEFLYFILPGTVPYLAAASRAAIGIALRISVVAEAFGASGGVGYWLVYSYDIGDKNGVFGWALVLILLMIAVDYAILRPIERWTERWRL
jgi:NitT/TauT family transport system permease protein